MSDLPAEDVELIEDPDEVHKIYRQSFIDEQVSNTRDGLKQSQLPSLKILSEESK